MATIDLFGAVGDDFDGFTAKSVANQIAEAGDDDLTVRINSPGGFAFDGVAIFNLLSPHRPRVEVVGLAASAASVIAMAGSEIVMRRGAMLMIHDAWGLTIGNAADHEAAKDELEVISDALAEIYASKTRGSREEMRALMLAETWMNGDDALEKGFATSLGETEAADEPEEAQAVLATMGCRNTLAEDEAAKVRADNRRRFVLRKNAYRLQELRRRA